MPTPVAPSKLPKHLLDRLITSAIARECGQAVREHWRRLLLFLLIIWSVPLASLAIATVANVKSLYQPTLCVAADTLGQPCDFVSKALKAGLRWVLQDVRPAGMVVFLAAMASGLFLLVTVERFREYYRQAHRWRWGVALMAVYATAAYVLFLRPMIVSLSDQGLLIRLAHPKRFRIAWAILSFWPLLGPLPLVLVMSVTKLIGDHLRMKSDQQGNTNAATPPS